jgi:hypothetical protein
MAGVAFLDGWDMACSMLHRGLLAKTGADAFHGYKEISTGSRSRLRKNMLAVPDIMNIWQSFHA